MIVLGFHGFHFSLGIDWMGSNSVSINIASKAVWIKTLEEESIVYFQGESVIFVYLFMVEVLERKLENIEVVYEFLDVFYEILGLPPKKVAKFRTYPPPGKALKPLNRWYPYFRMK